MLQSRIQLTLFPELEDKNESKQKRHARSGTFADNMKLPIHRWFRYSAGFSAEWVAREISEYKGSETIKVLDPFAGSATTLLSAESVNTMAVGFETHPFIYRVAKAKLAWSNVDIKQLVEIYKEVAKRAKKIINNTTTKGAPLLKKCFTSDSLSKLNALREVYLSDFDKDTPETEIVWLCITSIIRACSTAGTAQWQYVLPNKKKAKVLEPFYAFDITMKKMIEDISFAKENNWSSTAEILNTDARKPEYKEELFDLVITSPPYPNNYDYADATRLEMTFWGEIHSWGDLHSSVRKYLLRSCSQHSAKEKLELEELLDEDVILPIKQELSKACKDLENIRLTKGGKKTYHTMAAAYFIDLGKVFNALRLLVKQGGKMCFVVGDSAPYGVYLAVDKWLGELALSAGFKSFYFEKIRDRNIKWKNRKHRVPLHEGRLWIEG